MYILKNEMKIGNETKASKIIGIDIATLSRILHKKQKCSKILAYCIAKYIDQNAEITDYFIREEN
jgi:plasmid maintenance system antidote protein VapI